MAIRNWLPLGNNYFKRRKGCRSYRNVNQSNKGDHTDFSIESNSQNGFSQCRMELRLNRQQGAIFSCMVAHLEVPFSSVFAREIP